MGDTSDGRDIPKRFMIWVSMLVMVLLSSPAKAQDPVEVDYRDFSYPSGTGGNSEPTGEKPESKLWWNDGLRWGILCGTSGNAYHIHRLDLTTQSWVDTGTATDDRSDSWADVLWDRQHLLIRTWKTKKYLLPPRDSTKNLDSYLCTDQSTHCIPCRGVRHKTTSLFVVGPTRG